MNGKRAKKIKAAYRAVYGRDPHRGHRDMLELKGVQATEEGVRAYTHAFDNHGKLAFQKAMVVTSKSEYRQFKRLAQMSMEEYRLRRS